MTVKIQSVHKSLSQYSFPYIGIKQTSYIHNSEKAAIKYNISILVRSYVLRYSEQTCLQPLTNPSEDSQAWKTYSYLDEGAARGTKWDNRRIRCTVALHWEWLQHHPLYRRQSNLAVMCKDTYLPGEHFSTTFLYKKKKWKWMLTAACHCFIFWTSDLNRETSLRKGKVGREKSSLKDQFLNNCECNNAEEEQICYVIGLVISWFW